MQREYNKMDHASIICFTLLKANYFIEREKSSITSASHATIKTRENKLNEKRKKKLAFNINLNFD